MPTTLKVRWPELDIVNSTGKIIDEFWTQTDKGPIFSAMLFHIDELPRLRDLKSRIEAKKKELSDIEAEIYKIKR
jgi:hypothetical protein